MDEDKKTWLGFERETMQGTSMNPMIPKMWEPYLLKSLTVEGVEEARNRPRPKLTWRMRLRRKWDTILNYWPLMWKKNCDCGEDW